MVRPCQTAQTDVLIFATVCIRILASAGKFDRTEIHVALKHINVSAFMYFFIFIESVFDTSLCRVLKQAIGSFVFFFFYRISFRFVCHLNKNSCSQHGTLCLVHRSIFSISLSLSPSAYLSILFCFVSFS